MAFGDTVPVKSATMGAKISKGNINVAMCYVVVAKIGQDHAEDTCRLHKDLLVNPDWAFNLLQQGKVTSSTVRNVIIHCATNVPRLLANLEGYELALRERAEDEHMQSMRATVSGAFRPFRRLPEVVLWLATFQRMVCRYKFLVLEGPSQLGKTQFAVSLADPGRTLIIDCSGATEADLRRYRSDAVDTILFDEGKASIVLKSKPTVSVAVRPNSLRTVQHELPCVYCRSSCEADDHHKQHMVRGIATTSQCRRRLAAGQFRPRFRAHASLGRVMQALIVCGL